MKTNSLHIYRNIIILSGIYILLLLICFLFRVATFFVMQGSIGASTFSEIATMFWFGIRYDIVIATYLILFPFLLLTIENFIGRRIPILEKVSLWVSTISVVPFAFVQSADIPYFKQFFTHFNITAFDGMEGNFGTVAQMIIEEPSFILMAIPLIATVVVFYLCFKYLLSKGEIQTKHFVRKGIATLLAMLALFFGLRGNCDFKRRPLQVGDFYFSKNQTINQIALNPCFVFIKSLSRHDQIEIAFMDEKKAIAIVQKQLNIENPDKDFPLLQNIKPTEKPRKMNVVLIIMESMTSNNLQHEGNTKKITPFLDSLIDQSLYFENCYSSGNRTCCGIYATIVGQPTLYDHQPMYSTPIRQFNTLATELKRNGYSTTFFLSHDKNFDNCNGFLLSNGFEQVYSLDDYPAEAQKNMWGVSDDFLLTFANEKINALADREKPFFATILTISNHSPFYIPEKYKTLQKTEREQVVTFADDALKDFFEKSSKEKWFENTLFVLVGDHGTAEDATYPLPLSYFHIPLIFFSSQIQPAVSQKMAAQIDVMPTVLEFLNLPYTTNSMGINLLKKERPASFMTNSSGYAVIDNEWLLVYLLSDKKQRLYRYRDKNKNDYLQQYQEVAKNLETYATAHLQSAEYLLRMHKTWR